VTGRACMCWIVRNTLSKVQVLLNSCRSRTSNRTKASSLIVATPVVSELLSAGVQPEQAWSAVLPEHVFNVGLCRGLHFLSIFHGNRFKLDSDSPTSKKTPFYRDIASLAGSYLATSKRNSGGKSASQVQSYLLRPSKHASN